MKLEDATAVRYEFNLLTVDGSPAGRDAMTFTPAEWVAMTPAKLKRDVDERIANHRKIVSQPVEAKREAPREARVRLRRERADLLRRQAEVETAMADVDEAEPVVAPGG